MNFPTHKQVSCFFPIMLKVINVQFNNHNMDIMILFQFPLVCLLL